MTWRMGTCGQDIPFKTQFLIVEAHEGDDESAVYTFFLPILEGDFRAVLQGNEHNELEICLESVDEFEGSHLVFVGAGLNPFDVITKAVKTMERHLQTFSPPAEWFLCCCSVIIWALFNIGVQEVSCVRPPSIEAYAIELAIATAISLGLQLCRFLAHCASLSHNVVQWYLSCFVNQSVFYGA